MALASANSLQQGLNPLPTQLSAKMRSTLGPEINIAFRVGQTNAM
jgi:hypothetical protein